MSGGDDFAGLAHGHVVRNGAPPLNVRVRLETFSHHPLGKVEPVAQDETHHLPGRSPGFAGEDFESALLRRSQCQRLHAAVVP